MGEATFKDSFWTEDFNSTQGFDVLHMHMKESKAFSEDLYLFFKQRVQIEERYARDLIKLGEKPLGKTETCTTTRAAWDIIRAETMEIGNIHLQHAKKFSTELELPVKAFKDEQREFRKKIEDTLKKSQKLKTSRYQANDKAKRYYETKFRESEKADEDASKPDVLPKDLEKLKQKALRAQQTAEQADKAYHATVQQLEQARKLWEKEMEQCAQYFQEMEEERIDMTRRKLWLYANIASECTVIADQRLENMRVQLERVDITADIQEFIRHNQTGSSRPKEIKYQHFHASSAPTQPVNTTEDMVRVEFDYNAQGDMELSIKKGQVLRVLEKVNDTWWRCEVDGRSGVVPSTFVTCL
eukprot:m.223067 g.223067  ORF g.223067 m.223067 type:complete len:356 (-) comp15136_c0_seq2:964-2031(-)